MIFNSLNINVDSVEFEYVTKGNLEVVSVSRPDGISYSQWSGAWGAFNEFLASRQPTLADYVERQIDTSELELLEDKIEELKDEISNKDSEIAGLESEVIDLENEISRLEEKLAICRIRIA